MAVKASATITLSSVTDVASVTRYYLLQSSMMATPSKPTTSPPSGSWDDTEPVYTAGSTNSLYFVDLTVFSDGTWSYSSVSLSSSYEAAKEAYNKAASAQSTATAAQSTATAAQSTATAAQSTATAAQSTATAAESAAGAVRADLQRVIRIDQDGFHFGDTQSAGEVLLDSSSVNIVFNGLRYSRFAANYVQFGNYQLRRSSDGGLVFKLA